MKNINACLSHNTDDWKTPTFLYEYFMRRGYKDCFPFQSSYDEFEKSYYNELLFVNPPFSKLDKVSFWVIDQVHNGCSVVLLLPSRTDTKYFHRLLQLAPSLYFFEGRLHYNDSAKSSPFPSMLMFFEGNCPSGDYFSLPLKRFVDFHL